MTAVCGRDRLRIAYVYRHYRRVGSIATLYVDMVERLARDADVSAVCTSSTRASSPSVSFVDVEPLVSSDSRLGYALECWTFAHRAGRTTDALRDRFDVVHVEGFASMWADLVTVHAVRAAEVEHYFSHVEPCATIRRHLSPRLFRPQTAAVLAIERKLLRSPQPLVICPSRQVRDDVERYHGVPRDDIAVIPYGIDVAQFSPRIGAGRQRRVLMSTPPDRLVILMVASDFLRKGVGRAIEMLARAQADAELWIIGGDDPRPYRRAAALAGVGDRVRFVGPRPRNELPDWYAASDAFVAPSQQDSWALPVIEAMASGCVVVASSFAGSSEVLDHGLSGFVVDGSGDPVEMAALLDGPLADPHARRHVSERARREAHRFDSEVLYGQHLDAHYRASERRRMHRARPSHATVPRRRAQTVRAFTP